MGIAYNTSIAKSNLLGLMLDASNQRSFSPNVFPKPLDIFGWSSTPANAATLSRDSTTSSSPAGGIPLKMAISGNDPYTGSYNSSPYTISTAATGQTWTLSVYVKGSVATTGELFIFGADSSGGVFSFPDYGAGNINITTDWTRVSYSFTFSNANVAAIQFRLDGTPTGGSGTNIWWDGLQLERASSASTFNPNYNANGTSFKDLSSAKCHGTMYGAVPFTTDIVPCFDFATVTGASSAAATLGFTFATNPVTLTGGFTFSSWIKNPPSSSSQVGLFSNTGSATGFRYGIGLNGCYVLMAGADGSGYSEPTLAFSSSLSASLWYNVVMVFDRSGANAAGTPQWQLYLNGVLQTTSNMTTPQTVAMTTTAPGLVRSACCGLYTGKLAQFMVHNTPLSAADVLQNYNAYRGRFGV
jgi:hypothetical protein